MGVTEGVVAPTGPAVRLTPGLRAQAVMLAEFNDLRMKVPKEGHFTRNARWEGKAIIQVHVGKNVLLEESLHRPVGCRPEIFAQLGEERHSAEDPPGVLVHDEGRVRGCEEEDAVRSLVPDPVECQEVEAKGVGVTGRSQVRLDFLEAPFEERLPEADQALRLGRSEGDPSNVRLHSAGVCLCKVRNREQFILPKTPDPGPCGAPIALLHQDGRECDFQGRAGPPGISVTEVGAEPLINFTKSSGDSFHCCRCLIWLLRPLEPIPLTTKPSSRSPWFQSVERAVGFDWERNETHSLRSARHSASSFMAISPT